MAAAQGGGLPPDVRAATHGNRHGFTTGYESIVCASELFGMAGIGPKDLSLAMVYDCFTWAVLLQLEDFGFCPKGEGGPFVADGNIALDGTIPVNTNGGMLSEGYVHGLNHFIEATEQLRGEAGERQVPNAETALVTSWGATLGSATILAR